MVNSPIAISFTQTELSNGHAERTFDFTSVAPELTAIEVTVSINSNAGNTGTGSDNIQIDTEVPSGSVAFRNAADTQNLPTYINYTGDGAGSTEAISIRISCDYAQGQQQDWASYKVWGNLVGHTTEGTAYTGQGDNTNHYVTIPNVELVSGDGLKTVTAVLYDNAGHATTVTTSITLDQTKPTVSITPSRTILSNNSGFTSSILTLAVTESGSGQKEYRVWISPDITVASGQGSLPATVTINNTDLNTEGAHIVNVTVTDNAGNTTDPAATYTLTLDTSAPTVSAVSISNHNGYIGGTSVVSPFQRLDQISVLAGATDTYSAVSTCRCWISTVAQDTNARGTAISYTGSFNYGQIDTSAYVADGSTNNYAHVEYTDAVGNTAYGHSSAVIIDTQAPAAGSITNLPAVCHSATQQITLVPSDNTISAGSAGYYKLYGDIVNPDSTSDSEDWHEFNSATATIEFAAATPSTSAMKTVYIKWRDAAGNIQTATPFSKTVELDTATPTAELSLRDKNNNNPINNTTVNDRNICCFMS